MVKVSEIIGPLILVEGTAGVAYDELVEIELKSGEVRSGKVLVIEEDKALVQVFEGTEGLDVTTLKFRFRGKGLELPVSADLLGRIFSVMSSLLYHGLQFSN